MATKKASSGATAKEVSSTSIDTPVDLANSNVPVTYRRAQAVEGLVATLGYPTLPNIGSIGLNPRNSGTPSTENEARIWAATIPPFIKKQPIQKEDFGVGDGANRTILSPAGIGPMDDVFNFNFGSPEEPNGYRVLILVMNANTAGPRSVVITADELLDEDGDLVSQEFAAKWLLLRFDPTNPLNKGAN